MRLHLDAMYHYDPRGRMVSTREWVPKPAPRFHLARTRLGCIARVRHDLPEDLATALLAATAHEPPLGTPEDPPAARDEYLSLLATHARVERIWSGPNYRFPPPIDRPTSTMSLTPADAPTLDPALAPWVPDLPHCQPFIGTLEGDRIRAVCASVRITNHVHEAGVETAPTARRRGLASAAVSTWAHAVLAQAATPLYSTSWDNAASRRLAEKLSLELYGTTFHIT